MSVCELAEAVEMERRCVLAVQEIEVEVGKDRVMLTRKCDICGAEMRMTTPRYKVTFDGWLYTQEKDICIDCFKRIADEIKQADAPQNERSE